MSEFVSPSGRRAAGARIPRAAPTWPHSGPSRGQAPPLRGVRPVILLAGVLMTVGALYLGREFLIPLAVAGLLTFVLNPIVRVFERRLPRAAAVLLVVVLTFSVLGAFAWALALQAASLGGEIPSYRDNLKRKIAEVRGASRGGVIEKVQSATQGGRRGASEGRQAGQASREARARSGEAAGRNFLAASRRSGRARQCRPGARAGDLHAPGTATAARSSDPSDRLRPDRHDHQGHGRGRSADHPLSDDADPHQRHVRPRRGPGRPADRPSLRLPVGLPGRDPALHPLRRALGSRPHRLSSPVSRCSTDGSSRS